MNDTSGMFIFYRQKILLALLQTFNRKVNNVDFQKYLFLFTQYCQTKKSYDFVPYKFGCFSFQSYADRRKLVELNVLGSNKDSWELKSTTDFVSTLKKSDQEKLRLFHQKYAAISGEALIKKVYAEFPYYAINSEIADKLMTKPQLEVIKSNRPKQKTLCFFTIGYEGKSFESYLNQLITHNISLLCDVRKNPQSRKYGFSRKTLEATLETLGIAYVHIPKLGIVSDKRRELNSQDEYDRLFREYERTTLQENKDSLKELIMLMKKNKRIAITCFEVLECQCHRGRVASALLNLPDWKYTIQHL